MINASWQPDPADLERVKAGLLRLAALIGPPSVLIRAMPVFASPAMRV
jgi:hypothetical protein